MNDPERTQAMNAPASTPPYPPLAPKNAASEPTQAFAAQPIPPGDDPLASPERRRQLEADLSRLGVAPDEIRRLLSQQGETKDRKQETGDRRQPPPAIAERQTPNPEPRTLDTPKPGKGNRVTAGDLQAFAAQLASQKSAERIQAVEQAIVEGERDLPEFRESTLQERMQAEALLRDASMLRRREKFQEAESKCRQALDLVPRDAPALELLGDILQGVARTNEAMAAYKRATLADPKRASAERKYADLLTRQQNLDTGYDPEAVPPNPLVSSMMSLWLPGMGQIFNGEIPKAVFFFVCDALCALFVWATWAGFTPRHGSISGGMLISAILSLVVWIAALADATMTAKQKANGGP